MIRGHHSVPLKVGTLAHSLSHTGTHGSMECSGRGEAPTVSPPSSTALLWTWTFPALGFVRKKGFFFFFLR